MQEPKSPVNNIKEIESPQCQFFVLKKKRLCRMTVRPGRSYCGEHEPQPKLESGQDDIRIPCPNDPKHTCYASKLQKHLSICNARSGEQPAYIVPGVNAPAAAPPAPPRRALSQVPRDDLNRLIDKVNRLYEEYVQVEITEVAERAIHPAVAGEFAAPDRADSSRRHLRQASSLLWLAEDAGLVRDHTCYVELGAGKGHLSYHAWRAWCGGGAAAGSRVLLVDRASLRHKRDNKLRARPPGLAPGRAPAGDAPADDKETGVSEEAAETAEAATRLRADLAHLALHLVPAVQDARHVVGFAKHLCGVATDYALRCVTAEGARDKTRGVLIATCCHHRCDPHTFVGLPYLLELGVAAHELDALLGLVSWGTCGAGRPRGAGAGAGGEAAAAVAARTRTGRAAAALLDWARARHLRALGFRATLLRYVPRAVSPENLALLAVRDPPAASP